jgi:hypothetical protein
MGCNWAFLKAARMVDYSDSQRAVTRAARSVILKAAMRALPKDSWLGSSMAIYSGSSMAI